MAAAWTDAHGHAHGYAHAQRHNGDLEKDFRELQPVGRAELINDLRNHSEYKDEILCSELTNDLFHLKRKP